MARAQHSFFPAEGLPFLGAVVVAALLAWRFEVFWVLPPLAIALVLLVLLFRDPDRTIPAAPLAVVSPVDGKVIDIAPTDKGMLRREAQRAVPNYDGTLNLGTVMRDLEKLLAPDAILTTDAGNFAGWATRFLNFSEGQRYIGPLNGAMG